MFTTINIKDYYGRIILFALLLLYSVFSTGWYEKARIVIQGKAENTDSALVTDWDSGAGFNGYEREKFRFLNFRSVSDEKVQIRVTKAGKTHPDSRGSRIILSEIRVDDRGMYIPDSALRVVKRVKGRGLFFDSQDSAIHISVPAKNRISFIFATNSRSGIADISLEGEESHIDLYRQNWAALTASRDYWLLDEQGNFEVSFKAPRYKVDTLRLRGTGISDIEGVYLERNGDENVALDVIKDSKGNWKVTNPLKGQKRYFSINHFPLQVAVTLVLTMLMSAIYTAAIRIGGLKDVFVEDGRWTFWSAFGGAVLIYGCWLIAFWPGVMSVDSLNIWRAALLPDVIINNHPIINELYFFCLQQIWSHQAIVPIVQILALSLIIALTVYFLYRRGVHLVVILPWYLFILLSVPVGVYNISLWKDVPFALCVVVWALIPCWMIIRKRENGKIALSFKQVVFLTLTFMGLISFRYNGMVYLFVMPIILLLSGIVRIPQKVFVYGLVIGVTLTCMLIVLQGKMKSANYFHDLSRQYLSEISTAPVSQTFKNVITSYPRILDIKKNESTSDFWHYYLGDRYAYSFLEDAGWNDVFGYKEKAENVLTKNGMKIYKASLDYPWLYLSWFLFPWLYLMPYSILFYRRYPLTAIFSAIVLSQIIALLLLVGTTNWRYYYFTLIGGYFLIPLILIDTKFRTNRINLSKPIQCDSL